jgi:NAD(P)-dependent dehydrogenase (short-subunit alcohol dehydrogenase family)
VQLDVAVTRSAAAAVDRVETDLGPIIGWVNNAGVDVIKPFVDSTEDGCARRADGEGPAPHPVTSCPDMQDLEYQGSFLAPPGPPVGGSGAGPGRRQPSS